MEGYLGKFDVDINETKFKSYSQLDWVMFFIKRYGQIDGGHHKAWVLDQIARIIKGTKVIVKEHRWTNEQSEYDVDLDEPSQEYLDWVEEMKKCLDNPDDSYDYDEGIAP